MKICRFASRRSCGLLEEINIEYFGTDDLLLYIANNRISDRGLCEAVKKFPLLEELDISLSYEKITKASLEAIGRCCPLLKVLKFNKNYGAGAKDDDEAFTIAKTMSQLYHLEIIGNSLSNDGLLAILNGCPLLEVLDLRLCSNVKMSWGLWKKYCQQIKNLREPHDDFPCLVIIL
ncbi:putative F-box/LRR-repeat protein 23 [Lotus japonicus]|uniref:putative F-box/LRR-repeat protein 23 n=1 Tax=Lotus japonicus TaxID=34305 RepID=UPI002583AE74|nr:putative F-box/LRR-repeat protein 23 [Lotus japonicus]